MTSIVAGLLRLGLDAQRVVDLRQVAGLELDVDDRADHLNDFSDFLSAMFLSTLCSRIPSIRLRLQRLGA